ncbi:AraC-like DNA-binding protein [Microbacterium proteolyticum]|uniref:AraC-like DNA-binding protein n=1 Tax=Microbacterium proteolyticum TaxID=1572644 RepID=A0A7W5CI39_9MICO|nr:AraC-like DNA-binding protein [Microbacterium proteolyticum]
MSATWSLNDVRPRERHAFWRETLTTAFTPLRPEPVDGGRWGDGASLRGDVTTRPLGQLNIATIRSCAQQNVHGAAEVRRSDEEVFFVNLIVRGRCFGEQQGRECDLGPASIGIFDARRPFRLTYTDDWDAISVRVPTRDAAMVAWATSAPTSRRVAADRGTGRLLAGVMTGLARADGSDIDGTREALVDAFLLLLGAAASGTGGAMPSHAEVDAQLHDRIRAHVRDTLREGPVEPNDVARRFHISVRKLHQLFEQSDRSFGRTVLAMRVDAVARDLDAGSPATLSELAATWGFADASHLHRAFRAHTGRAPGEYRRTRLAA